MILFLIFGHIALVLGVLTLLGNIKVNIDHDETVDKLLMTARTRYLLGRYWAGMNGIAAGVGAIALYTLSTKERFDMITSNYQYLVASILTSFLIAAILVRWRQHSVLQDEIR